MQLFESYGENVDYLRSRLRASESFDIIERRLKVAGVEMRFFYGKTQTEISDEIGISQAQVSRLEKNAIKALRLTTS